MIGGWILLPLLVSFFSLFYRDSIMGAWEDLEWFSLGRIHHFEVKYFYLAPRAL